ncbi:MAG: HAD family hydrolase [Candidatus Woesearchaeota archaeon]
MEIKVILFDYDGVIVDTFPNLCKIYREMCARFGGTYPATNEEFRDLWRGQDHHHVQNVLGIRDLHERETSKFYREEILKATPPLFPGIREALQQLQDYELVILSSTHSDEINDKLQRYGLAQFFSRVIARDGQQGIRKDKLIRDFLKERGMKPDVVVLIGDRSIDFEEGTKAGLKNIILVEYGWGYTKDIMPKQLVLVNAASDIPRAIQAIARG